MPTKYYSRSLSVLSLLLLLSACGVRRPQPQPVVPPVKVDTTSIELTPWVRPTGDSIRQEMRGVWLTTVWGLDWPKDKADTPDGIRRQKESLDRTLRRLKADGYNTVFLQVRHSGTTLYRSPYEPASPAIAGEGFFEAGYDPLTYAVEACHQLGLAVHAWMVTYPLVSPKRSPHPLLRDHADWAIAHKGSYHLDPGNPEVRSYVAHLATDLARRYAIDGVHFDYFRYPEAAETFNDRTSYARYGSSFPSKAAWRRDNLTRQLREVRDSLASIGSDIQVSVAPLGKLKMIPDLGRSHGWTAYESVYQDPETWGREGLVDFVVPMMYYRGDLYSPFLQDWKEKVAPYIPVIPGLAAYRVEESGWPSSVIAEQIAEEREVGLGGVCFFREQHTSSRFPLVRQVIEEAFASTALPLALKRGEATAPAAPEGLHAVFVSKKEFNLSWTLPRGASTRGITYRLWVTTTDSHGRRTATLLAQGLRSPECRLTLEDFVGDDCAEFGVEAVNSFGVATPIAHGLELNLAALRLEQQH